MQTQLELAKSIIRNTLFVELNEENFPKETVIEQMAKEYLTSESIQFPDSIRSQLDTVQDEYADCVLASIEARLYLLFHRHQPTEDEDFAAQAEDIIVKISGRPFKTYVDHQGVQRFRPNFVIRHIVEKADAVDLNQLNIEYQQGLFSHDDWLEFFVSMGYSVRELCELSGFRALDVENPLWN